MRFSGGAGDQGFGYGPTVMVESLSTSADNRGDVCLPLDKPATFDVAVISLKRRNWPSNDVHGNMFCFSLGCQGSRSEVALSPEEVIAGSQPRSMAISDGAAHFELANHHLWRCGHAALAIAHVNECTACNRASGRTSARPGPR